MNVSLKAEWESFIQEQVASGEYDTASEVVRAGLRALKERDEAVERWLSEEVAARYDAMKANPASAIPAETAFARIRARHAAKGKVRQ